MFYGPATILPFTRFQSVECEYELKTGCLASGNFVTVYGDERWQVSLESR